MLTLADKGRRGVRLMLTKCLKMAKDIGLIYLICLFKVAQNSIASNNCSSRSQIMG